MQYHFRQLWCIGWLAFTVAVSVRPARATDKDRQGDLGIFGDLDSRVALAAPPWLSGLVCTDREGRRWQSVLGAAVAAASARQGEATPAACASLGDADGDGWPDQIDILRGAKKTALDAAPYGSPYRPLSYPGGDVPRGEGVCTDVVIRALRNSGFDLQKLVREDIARAPGAYPMVSRPNPNIDQRRVRTILPWFRRHWLPRPTDAGRLDDWLPGDVVFMDTLARPGPDHIGVVSDRLGQSGKPLIINSWTDGYVTSEMDLLPSVPVTHRFRVPPPNASELAAVLSYLDWQPGSTTRQLVVVRAAGAQSSRGELHRWQLHGDTWRRVGLPAVVDLGAHGVAWGRGLHRQPALKREGDGKTPMGVFRFGTAFGRGNRPTRVRWQWRTAGDGDRWVDDPASPFYNRWADVDAIGAAHSEVLARSDGLYDLALVIDHNADPILAGAGSAIFIHLSGSSPTAGCIALGRAELLTLLRWLDRTAAPILVVVDR